MHRKFITTHQSLCDAVLGIGPQDIPFLGRSSEARDLEHRFGKAEVDICASRLVQFFQREGDWRAFSRLDLEAFYAGQGLQDIFGLGILYGLAEDWWDESGEFRGDFVRATVNADLMVTDEFILRCAGYTHVRIKALENGSPE
ncbi:MAG TPA: hypothetical protein VHO23_02280 [Candidatus Paceibacterota bacterium]|nr:hypothetical protein [Candidatus Paceibacterota bacterium]